VQEQKGLLALQKANVLQERLAALNKQQQVRGPSERGIPHSHGSRLMHCPPLCAGRKTATHRGGQPAEI
jgi:hypothetical protein